MESVREATLSLAQGKGVLLSLASTCLSLASTCQRRSYADDTGIYIQALLFDKPITIIGDLNCDGLKKTGLYSTKFVFHCILKLNENMTFVALLVYITLS